MSSELPERVFQRESSLLLRRIAGGKGFLIPAAKPGLWHLFTKRTGFRRPAAEVDSGFIEAMRRAGLLVSRPGGGLMAVRVDANEPCHSRPLTELGAEQADAAERLARDFALAHLDSRVTSNWDAALLPTGRRRSADERDISNSALAARRRFFAALDVVGPELAPLLCEVCCLSAGSEQAERRLGLPGRSGRALLNVALTRLARHYGLLQPRNCGRRGKLEHWSLPGFRPEVGN